MCHLLVFPKRLEYLFCITIDLFSFRHPLRPNVTTTLLNLEESLFLIYAKGNVIATTSMQYIFKK